MDLAGNRGSFLPHVLS